MYITDNQVNDGHKSAIFLFIQVEIFQAISLPQTAHFVSK